MNPISISIIYINLWLKINIRIILLFPGLSWFVLSQNGDYFKTEILPFFKIGHHTFELNLQVLSKKRKKNHKTVSLYKYDVSKALLCKTCYLNVFRDIRKIWNQVNSADMSLFTMLIQEALNIIYYYINYMLT